MEKHASSRPGKTAATRKIEKPKANPEDFYTQEELEERMATALPAARLAYEAKKAGL